MNKDLLSGVNEQILMHFKTWKILPLTTLHELTKEDYPVSYQALSQRAKMLERFGYLSSFFYPWYNRKYLYPTTNTINELFSGDCHEVTKSTLIHDAITFEVVSHLMNHPKANGHALLDDAHLGVVDPDALILWEIDGATHQMAIEIELTAKSEKRIREKINRYARAPEAQSILYIFNKQTAYRKYTRIIENFPETVKNRFLFLYSPNLNCLKEDLMKSKALFAGYVAKLNEHIFGEL